VPPLPADQLADAAEQAEEARQEGKVELHAHHQEAGQCVAMATGPASTEARFLKGARQKRCT
jgi:phosphoserine phosphatase